MQNVGYWIGKNKELHRDKRALVDGPHVYTYAALDARVNRAAHALRAAGCARGERVAMLLPNCHECVELVFAAAKIGALAVPLNTRLSADELAFILRDAEPRVLVYDPAFKELCDAVAERTGAPYRSFATGPEAGQNGYEAALGVASESDALDATVTWNDPLLIMYTAGTTGLPKGVVLTHGNTFWQSVNGWALGVDPETVCLAVLPLFHVGGLNGSVTPMLHVGATVVLHRRFDAKAVLNAFTAEGVTGMVGVPAMYLFISQLPEFATADLSRVRVLISGGAPLSEALIRTYQAKGVEFRQGYGLTETSPGVTGMGPGECVRKLGSAGKPCLYTDVRVVDDAGRPLPAGESGEIWVRGPNVMQGYWRRPAETEAALAGGWFHTGDIGRFDADGFLYIVDRKKDMIISGGENVYPAEIENRLYSHPAVREAAVLGRPDERWGEVPIAVVALREPGAGADELTAFCREGLAAYKVPKAFVFVDALPRNAAGKVLKPELKRQVLGGSR